MPSTEPRAPSSWPAPFENSRERLWPGQYVTVALALGAEKDAVVVPARAVQAGRDSKYVFVVKADQTVEMRPVTAGRLVGEEMIIQKGLAAGETVVTDGHVRLAKGAKVDIKPGLTLKSGTAAPAATDTAAPAKAAPGQEVPPTKPAVRGSGA